MQKGRVARIKGDEMVDGIRADEKTERWKVELMSATAEALAGLRPERKRAMMRVSYEIFVVAVVRDLGHGSAQRDDDAERTNLSSFPSLVHQLTVTLAFLIRLSPFYEDQLIQLVPLLSVLQVGEMLKGKLAEVGDQGVGVGEVANRLCSVCSG
ncbi:hypothetical protein DFH94DRAFT_803704 [Russula ochroleuca]|jgi:hypothetical protein|uniref:Uncharacterized protein n=1 Tax=Russula ochroleuca TaxID=152965 RepID=A0A9P5MS64_9AGAM|nr:hypothetical protein DFH94DRAFT_803704 [Russula ochroleuca]